jgi:glycosyltransferase involved in cell wall biosynthesis
MRFLFISTMGGYPWGGSEELWSRTAIRLAEEGHQVVASVTYWPTPSPKVLALKNHGVDIQMRGPAPAPTLASRIGRRLSRKTVSQEQKDLAWLRDQKPDLVVVSQGSNKCGLSWMKRCREAGLPFVSIVQCNDETWWPSDIVSSEMLEVYRAARKVFCVSRHNLRLLEDQIGESLPHAEVVWNPFNVPAEEPPLWPKENRIWKLACVARLEPAAKGQDLLFHVLSHPQWRERPVEANLYGQGPWEQNLKRLAAYLELKNVRFHEHKLDVKQIWETNHLLVLPSRCEGLPLTLVEAMWCARPAVVTDVGGNTEVCVDGETGFVAAAPTVPLLEEAMERAWNRRADWPSIGQAARAHAKKLIPNDPVGDFCQLLLAALPPS